MACFQYRNVYRGSMGPFLCRGAHPVLGFFNGNRLGPAHTLYRLYRTDEIGSSCGGSWIGDRPNTRPHWPCFTILGCSWRVCFLNYSQSNSEPHSLCQWDTAHLGTGYVGYSNNDRKFV